MDIHRFEAIWIAASLLLIVGWIATVTYGAVGVGVTMVGDDGGTIDESNPTDSPDFRDPGVYAGESENEYDVYVIARQFQFAPGTLDPIRLPANSEVTFYITSPDVIHGFEVPSTNLNVMVIPGQITKATVEFDEPATYGIICNEYCGAAHHTMEGQIEVVPESEFNASEVAA